MTKRRVIVMLLATFGATTGCTAQELAQWVEWYGTDPTAAVEFANRPEVQAQIADVASGERVPLAASVWDDIAWCESGGNWSHRPVTNRHGTFSGGLMIGHQWWRHYGGRTSMPYVASKAHQIEVAENIAADVGLDRGWQCYG